MSPQQALAELAALLEHLEGEAALILRSRDRRHRWRISQDRPAVLEPAARAVSGEQDELAVETLLSEMHRNLLAAAQRDPHASHTGAQLTEIAGYIYSPAARSALSQLRRWGLLSGGPGQAGYQITAEGRQVLVRLQRTPRDPCPEEHTDKEPS